MFSDSAPKLNDSENNFLFKWAQAVYAVDSTGGAPLLADSNNTLLFKLCAAYSNQCPAADATPKHGDSDNVLLAKILKSTFVCPGV